MEFTHRIVPRRGNAAVGCLFVVVLLVIWFVWSCNSSSPPKDTPTKTETKASDIENANPVTGAAVDASSSRFLVPVDTPPKIVHGFDIANYAARKTDDETFKTSQGAYWSPEMIHVKIDGSVVQFLRHESVMMPRFKQDDEQYLASLVGVAIGEFLGSIHRKKAMFIVLPSHYDDEITKKLRATNGDTISMEFSYGVMEAWELNDTPHDAKMTIVIRKNAFSFRSVEIDGVAAF